MSEQIPSAEQFEDVYRNHVEKVVEGDLRGVMDDMDPDVLSHVFDGVTVPRGDVSDAVVLGVRIVDGRGIGEAVYTTTSARIALRSGWRHDGTAWKADSLENFEPIPHFP